MDTETKGFIFFVRSYCVCTPQAYFNNICSSCQSCHVLRSMKRLLQDLCIKGRRLLQDQVQLGIGEKVQLQVGISGYVRVVGKIPYTYNCLIVDQWILRSGELKITWWGFWLARGSWSVHGCPLFFDRLCQRRESMAGFSLTALCLASTALCHISNHENMVAKERCKLNQTCVPFLSDLIS